MMMQKYRADISTKQPDGATVWHASWMGGHTLSKINNCRVINEGNLRRTVYATGEPDTWDGLTPAVCKINGKRVKGYAMPDNDNLVFRTSKRQITEPALTVQPEVLDDLEWSKGYYDGNYVWCEDVWRTDVMEWFVDMNMRPPKVYRFTDNATVCFTDNATVCFQTEHDMMLFKFRWV